MLNKKIKCIAVLLVILICGVFFEINWFKSSPQKIRLPQSYAMKNLLVNMKTYCIGHYLIDLPSSYEINKKDSYYISDAWDADISESGEPNKFYIAAKKMYYPSFTQLIQLREKELSQSTTIDADNMPFLKKVWKLPEGMDGVVFERNENESTDDAIRILESYYYNNGVAIKVQKQSINDSASRYDTIRGNIPPRNNIIEDITKMQLLLSRVSGREEGEIPTKPGNCIHYAFISKSNSLTEQENISVTLASNDLKNIFLNISTDNFTRESSGLLTRSDEISNIVEQSGGHIERKGSFTNNGLYVEELLAIGLQRSSEAPRYRFDLYINETTTSHENPNFIISLDNEGSSAIPYEQGELIAFWDSITRTIRLRPNSL